MSKERPRLSRLGVLAPAALSACIDASVLGAPAAGAIVATVLNELSKAFMLKKWFHGVMSAQQAEQLLMERGRNGSYLVRESQSQPGEYALSVRVRGRVTHVLIRKEQNKYDVGSGEHFDDLVGLIEHFRAYPMTEPSGDVVRLMQPVSGAAGEPSQNVDREAPEIDPAVKKATAPLVDPNIHRALELQNLLEQNMFFSTNIGTAGRNASKNRYKNILPFDQTRVILPDEDGCGNYINASHIRPSKVMHHMSCFNEDTSTIPPSDLGQRMKIHVKRTASDDALIDIARFNKIENPTGVILPIRKVVPNKCYIATQGCKANTVEDFWLMIHSQDVKIIVMLTQADSGGLKCQQYWPSIGTMGCYRGVSVRTIFESVRGHYTVRHFELQVKGRPKHRVYQYQFETWPDHRTPNDTLSIISFIEEINGLMLILSNGSMKPENNICVHCSAGIGRTGTFIAIDMLMDIIKDEGLQYGVDIISVVQLLRAQRPGMVQNCEQFMYIHEVLRDYIAHEMKKLDKLVKKDEPLGLASNQRSTSKE